MGKTKAPINIFGATRRDAGSYFRLTCPLDILDKASVHNVSIGLLSPDALADTDILWLHQHCEAETELLVRDFKSAGGKVIYDVDDWLVGLPPSWPCYAQYRSTGSGDETERLVMHGRLMELSDLITTTTERLAGNLRRLLPGKDVKVLPNCVLRGHWDYLAPSHNQVDGKVLGWFGTENHWDDWMEIVGPVDEALEETGAYLAILGAPELVQHFPERLKARTFAEPLVRIEEFGKMRQAIRAFDVGLAWCTDRLEANACRSPLKLFQYGAAGVPAVVSDTVYGDVAADLQDVLVTSLGGLKDEIVYALKHLKSPAPAFQQYVWDYHSYETQVWRWQEVVEELCP